MFHCDFFKKINKNKENFTIIKSLCLKISENDKNIIVLYLFF